MTLSCLHIMMLIHVNDKPVIILLLMNGLFFEEVCKVLKLMHVHVILFLKINVILSHLSVNGCVIIQTYCPSLSHPVCYLPRGRGGGI